MNKSKIEKRLPEPQRIKEQKADDTSVRPAIAKPIVVCSPCLSTIPIYEKSTDTVKEKVNEIFSLLTEFDINQAKSILRIVSNCVYFIGEKSNDGVKLVS